MSETAAAVDPERFHGRNRVTSRAIRSVVSAITAAQLGVDAKNVGVELSDNNGELAIAVSAPIAMAGLVVRGAATRNAAPGSSALAGSTLVDRASSTQNIIRSRVWDLTGSTAGIVNIRLTGARIREEVRAL
jgi:hypothetical protein